MRPGGGRPIARLTKSVFGLTVMPQEPLWCRTSRCTGTVQVTAGGYDRRTGAARRPARGRGGVVTRHDGGDGPRTGTDAVAFRVGAGRTPVSVRVPPPAGLRALRDDVRPLLRPSAVRGAVVEAI